MARRLIRSDAAFCNISLVFFTIVFLVSIHSYCLSKKMDDTTYPEAIWLLESKTEVHIFINCALISCCKFIVQSHFTNQRNED